MPKTQAQIITGPVRAMMNNRSALTLAVICMFVCHLGLAQSAEDTQDRDLKQDAAELFDRAKSRVVELGQAQMTLADQNRAVKQGAAALYKRAETRVRQRRFDDAQEILGRAIARYPESGVFISGVLTEPYYPHYLLGLVHMELEQYDDAINQFLEEERQGQIQHDTDAYETLALRLARARQTDNQSPVIKVAESEVIETVFDAGQEAADVRFHGVIVDPGGVASLTIDAREINFRQSPDGYTFDETVYMSPLQSSVSMVVADVMGNRSEQQLAIELPALDLGAAAEDIYAVLVGVDRYASSDKSSGIRCAEAKSSCRDQSTFSCYNLPDLKAAANDAQRFNDFLIQRGVPAENIQLLLSNDAGIDATSKNVRLAIDKLKGQKNGKAIFYFAGHGVNSRRHKNLMLLSDTDNWECGDAQTDEVTPLEATSLGVDTIEIALMEGGFDERYVILDACRTPRLASTRSVDTSEPTDGFSSRGINVIPDEIRANATGEEPVVFYATFDRSVSVEWNQKKAGYFTWYLLQGLRRNLSLWDLKSFVQEKVQHKTLADHGITQKPHVTLPDQLENDYDRQKRTFLLGSGDDGEI